MPENAMTPDQLRAELERLGLSQVGAANALGIDPRTMRRYLAGDLKITKRVQLALAALALRR